MPSIIAKACIFNNISGFSIGNMGTSLQILRKASCPGRKQKQKQVQRVGPPASSHSIYTIITVVKHYLGYDHSLCLKVFFFASFTPACVSPQLPHPELTEIGSLTRIFYRLARDDTIPRRGGPNANFGSKLRISGPAIISEFTRKVASPLSHVLPSRASAGPGRHAFVPIVLPQAQSRLDRGAWFGVSGLFRPARE